MTQSTNLNGAAPRGGVVLPFARLFTLSSPAPRSLALRRPHAPSDHRLAAVLRQAQARRAQVAAQAAAGRRAVIAAALALLGMVAGVVVLEREIQLQGQEVRHG